MWETRVPIGGEDDANAGSANRAPRPSAVRDVPCARMFVVEVEFVDGEVDGGVVDDVRASARQDVGDDATPKGFAVAVVAGRWPAAEPRNAANASLKSLDAVSGVTLAHPTSSGASVDVGDAFAVRGDTHRRRRRGTAIRRRGVDARPKRRA